MSSLEREPVDVREQDYEVARRYPMTVGMEDGYWVARVPVYEFRFVIGAGESPQEAADALVGGLALAAAVAEREGRAMPEPAADYSGQVNARLPKSLHQALAQRAEIEGLSVNATLVYLLTQALAPDRAEKPKRRKKAAKASAGG